MSRNFVSRRWVLGAAVLSAVSLASQANAAAITSLSQVNLLSGSPTLDQLTAAAPEGTLYNGIQVDDKVFYNFHVVAQPQNLALNTLTVTPISDPTGTQEGFNTPVWGFKLSGALSSALGASNTADLNLDYEVQVIPGFNNVITDAHIKGNPDVAGTGLAHVSESWATDLPNQPPIAVFDFQLTQDSPPNTQLSDGVDFNGGFTHLFANKDINLEGFGNGVATISYIDQVYSQGTGSTPEPASLGILAIGGLGLLVRRRRA